MLDARATRIKESVIAVVNSQPLKDKLFSNPSLPILLAKSLLENGWVERFGQVEELSPFKPSGDKVKDHFMKVALFALIKDKEPGKWSEGMKRKLDSEYISLHAKAGNTDILLMLEPAWGLCAGLILEAAFYLTKYNASPNAGPLVQFLPIINLLLLACTLTMMFNQPWRPPVCFSATARNILMPASRLDQDPRLLDALKLEIENIVKTNSAPEPQ